MMDGDACVTRTPTPAEAAQALGQLDDARIAVEQEAARFRPDRPLMLATMAGVTVFAYACKDVVPARVRRAGAAMSWFAAVGYGGWVGYRTRVTAVRSLDSGEALEVARARERRQAHLARAAEREQAGQPPERDAVVLDQRTRQMWTRFGKALALAGVRAIGERLVVAGLRRSSLPYPNVIAGLVLAATRTTISALKLQTRLLEPATTPTADTPPDDSPTEPPSDRLQHLLLDPTRLRIVALLAVSTGAEFSFVRDASGLTDSALTEQVHNLCNHQLVEMETNRAGFRMRTWIRLTVRGHDAVASHTTALTTIAQQTPERQ